MQYRKQTVITLLILILFISSCRIIKLIRVKNQMAEFNKNFEVKDENGLSLMFLKPLLDTKDISWFMSTDPTIKNSEVWIYEIKKRYKRGKGEEKNFDVPIKLDFEKNKLTVATLPKRFSQYIPKSMFAKFLQSLGKGKMSKTKKNLRALYKSNNKYEILTTQDIIALLGLPYYIKVKQEEKSFIYRYVIISPDVNNKVGVRFNYNFNTKTELLKSITANIKGFDILIEFSEG